MSTMRPSPWSIGIVMLAVGAGSVAFAGTHGVPPTAASIAAAAVLCAGGVAMLVRRRWSFWVALGAALATVALAVVNFVFRREPPIGLPLPSIVTLVIGLYLTLRILLAKSAFDPPLPPVETDEP